MHDGLCHISLMPDGTTKEIQAVIEAGVCPRVVELLSHPSPSVLIPALRTLRNIARGDVCQRQCIIEHRELPEVHRHDGRCQFSIGGCRHHNCYKLRSKVACGVFMLLFYRIIWPMGNKSFYWGK